VDERSICLFLAMMGLSVREAQNKLEAVLGFDVIGSSIITRYLQQRQFPASSRKPSDEPPTTIIDDAIPEALDKQPFSSVKELATLTCIPTTPVYRHLRRSLGFVLKQLRSVPDTLTDTQTARRVTLSNQLLLELLSIKHHRWHFVITLDESWFYLSTHHQQIWLRADQELPERVKHRIQDKKIMVTIAWNPLGFHLVEALPKGRNFNAEYYGDHILAERIRFRSEAGERYLVIHADNALPHSAQNCRTFCAGKGLRPATYRPSSPGLVP
jgi:hypothetical protein